MTYGGDYLYNVLSNSASLLAYIGTSLYNGTMVPMTDESLKTVNFYRIGGFDGGQEWFRQEWSIDCRAKDEKTSREIAGVVFDELNRKSGSIGGFDYFGVATVGQTVPPIDAEDLYNTPVTLILRRR
jgi:hypothetical protein